MKVNFWAKATATIILIGASMARAQENAAIPLPKIVEKDSEAARDALAGSPVSPGTRVAFESRGFSFVPPRGWEHGNVAQRSGLLFQMPKVKGQYQKTIQVQSFKGGVSWDDYSFQNYQKYIINRFSAKSDLISNYIILNYQPFDLDNGQPAIAYYATFKYGELKMMQLHVLVSTMDRHFLTTFTDLASNFSANAIPPDLEPVYASMRTIQVDGEARSSVDKILWIAASMVGALVLFFLIRSLSQWVKFNRLKAMANEIPEMTEHSMSGANGAGSHKSADGEWDADPVYSVQMEHHLADQANLVTPDEVGDLDFDDKGQGKVS